MIRPWLSVTRHELDSVCKLLRESLPSRPPGHERARRLGVRRRRRRALAAAVAAAIGSRPGLRRWKRQGGCGREGPRGLPSSAAPLPLRALSGAPKMGSKRGVWIPWQIFSWMVKPCPERGGGRGPPSAHQPVALGPGSWADNQANQCPAISSLCRFVARRPGPTRALPWLPVCRAAVRVPVFRSLPSLCSGRPPWPLAGRRHGAPSLVATVASRKSLKGPPWGPRGPPRCAWRRAATRGVAAWRCRGRSWFTRFANGQSFFHLRNGQNRATQIRCLGPMPERPSRRRRRRRTPGGAPLRDPQLVYLILFFNGLYEFKKAGIDLVCQLWLCFWVGSSVAARAVVVRPGRWTCAYVQAVAVPTRRTSCIEKLTSSSLVWRSSLLCSYLPRRCPWWRL